MLRTFETFTLVVDEKEVPEIIMKLVELEADIRGMYQSDKTKKFHISSVVSEIAYDNLLNWLEDEFTGTARLEE